MKKDINKKIAVILAAALSMSLAACGNSDDDDEDEKPAKTTTAAAESEEETETTTTAAETEAETETTTEAETTTAAETSAPEETTAAEDSKPAEGGDGEFFTDANSPAPIGQWCKVAVHSSETDQQEYVYIRILGTDPNGQDEVDKFNSNGGIVTLAEPKYDCVKYFKVDYEVRFPDDFPSGDYGSYSDVDNIYARNPDGSSFTKDGTTYIGLGSLYTTTKSEGSENPKPGDTVQRTAVYAMLDDADGYVFQVEFKDKDGDDKTCYLASK